MLEAVTGILNLPRINRKHLVSTQIRPFLPMVRSESDASPPPDAILRSFCMAIEHKIDSDVD